MNKIFGKAVTLMFLNMTRAPTLHASVSGMPSQTLEIHMTRRESEMNIEKQKPRTFPVYT